MKRPGNETVINALAALALLALGGWLIWATEWVDVWRPVPLRGEAAGDQHHAIKLIATRLGVKVTTPHNLDALPPPGATLVLESDQWDFVPGRSERLRQWVEQQGGHLVLSRFSSIGEGIDWVPVQPVERKGKGKLGCTIPRDNAGSMPADDEDEDHEDGDEDKHDSRDAEAERRALERAWAESRRLENRPDFVGPRRDPAQTCAALVEARPGQEDDAQARRLRLCNAEWMTSLEAKAPATPTWWLSGARGVPALRVELGKGRVTALGAWGFFGQQIFHGDHAQAALALMDLKPGDEVWFVTDERRDALAIWLWHRAGPAIALALVALAFALWRGALRFGPLLPQAPAARRSVAEQIRGTAAFVWRGDGAALVAAARRALDEAARTRINGWDQLTTGQRVDALRAPTALPDDALARALDPHLPPARSKALADKLALLEQARRRLALNKNP